MFHQNNVNIFISLDLNLCSSPQISFEISVCPGFLFAFSMQIFFLR